LTAAERLKEFLDGIEAYITAKNITPTKFNPEFAVAETLSLSNLDKLTQDDCFGYAYQLMQYVDHVGTERAQCENVIRWCENSLQSIISEALNSGVWDTYAKHETKVATILRNDDLARKINEWKLTAQGRLENIKSREYNVRRKADILFEKGKRK
tara:strand:- start:4857 stop:5321 length:465 start_codon:yes stop_codon:yes gene_type:complete